MKGHRLLVPAVAAVALIASFAVGFELQTQSLTEPKPPPPPTSLRTQVLDDLEAYYYRALPRRVYHARDVTAMLRTLGDPYTRYLPPVAYSQLKAAEAGTYQGMGLALHRAQRGLLVTASIPGLPGRAAGIRPGDVITTIDGTSLASLSYQRAVDLIGGRVGSQLHLQIMRTGQLDPMSLTIVRRPIKLPSVVTHVVTVGGMQVCVIRLVSFPATAAAKVRAAAARARRKHQAVILDLRGNPGGLLSQAVAVVRVFANKGVVVTTRGRHEPPREFVADGTDIGPMPMAVLINGGTASAAEAVAGALKADAGALLVGRRTYGKGTVQAVEPLANGGALKLTVAGFRLPGGTVVEGHGVRPDLFVPPQAGPTDRVLAAALQALRKP